MILQSKLHDNTRSVYRQPLCTSSPCDVILKSINKRKVGTYIMNKKAIIEIKKKALGSGCNCLDCTCATVHVSHIV